MRVRALRGPEDAVEIRLGIAEGDVAQDRFVEHMIFLENKTDLPAQVAVVQGAHVHSVVEDRSRRWLEKTRQQLHQSGLAASASPDDGDHPARRDVQIDLAENLR